MDRVIKFRGLRTDGKGWIYGWLFRDGLNGKMAIQQDTYETMIDTGHKVKSVKSREVIPSSVGQFTGLHDKNGLEIYEGDKDYLGRVLLWNDDMTLLCWHYYNEYRKSYYPSSYPCYKNELHKITIIGNIHEESEVQNV